jgi:site-specific recombinase XerD
MADNFLLPLHRFAEQLELKSYGKRTVAEYPRMVAQCLAYLAEHEQVREVGDVTAAHLKAYHTYLQFTRKHRGKSLSKKSICGILGALKTFYRIMSGEKLIENDLSESIQLPIARKHIPRHVPGAEDVRRMLEAAAPADPLTIRDRAILEFLYATGIRSEELRTIRIDDYDMTERQVFIRGKGSRDRIVPVGAWVEPYVSDYLENSRPKLLRKKTTDLLFVSRNGCKLNRNALWYLVQRYAKKAGVEHVMPHAFRHACATHLLRNGADIRIVQELLGHRSLASTQVYTKVDIHFLQQAHTKFHPRERWEGEKGAGDGRAAK